MTEMSKAEKNTKNHNKGQFIGTYKTPNAKKIPDVPHIEISSKIKIKRTEDILPFISQISNQEQEFLIVITLRLDLSVIKARIVGIGDFNEITISTRSIVRGACIDNAFGIIIVHNHPAGKMGPSPYDKKHLKALRKCSKCLDISILDALIVSGNRWRSYWPKRK